VGSSDVGKTDYREAVSFNSLFSCERRDFYSTSRRSSAATGSYGAFSFTISDNHEGLFARKMPEHQKGLSAQTGPR